MLTEAILGAIVEAIFGYALEQIGVGNHLCSVLGRDPVKRTFSKALREAISETLKRKKTSDAWSTDARWGDKNNPAPRYSIELK